MHKLGYLALLAGLTAGCVSLRLGSDESAKAPPTHGRDGSGRAMSLDEHRGKVVLLNFWHGA